MSPILARLGYLQLLDKVGVLLVVGDKIPTLIPGINGIVGIIISQQVD